MKVRLRELRKSLNLTQDQLAAAIGCTKSHVSEMEAGKKNPSGPLLDRMAAYFKISVSDLIDEREPGGAMLRSLMDEAGGLSEADLEALMLTAKAMRQRAKQGEDEKSVRVEG